MNYIIYLDESYEKSSEYVIMVGFIAPLEKWKILNDEINQLKIKYFKDPYYNLKKIRRNKYDKEKIWDSLTQQQKDEFNNEFYEIITKEDYTIIASVIDKEKMENKTKELIFHLNYSFIIQRYEYFLSEHNSYGLAIMDEADASVEVRDLLHSHEGFLKEGVSVKREDIQFKLGTNEIYLKDYKKRQLNHICENLTFQDDEDNNMLQITDMIAAAMFAKFNRSSDVWYNKIEKIIRHNSDGKIEGWGLKVFPKEK